MSISTRCRSSCSGEASVLGDTFVYVLKTSILIYHFNSVEKCIWASKTASRHLDTSQTLDWRDEPCSSRTFLLMSPEQMCLGFCDLVTAMAFVCGPKGNREINKQPNQLWWKFFNAITGFKYLCELKRNGKHIWQEYHLITESKYWNYFPFIMGAIPHSSNRTHSKSKELLPQWFGRSLIVNISFHSDRFSP